MQGTLEPHLIENGLTFAEWLALAGVGCLFVVAVYCVTKFIKIAWEMIYE